MSIDFTPPELPLPAHAEWKSWYRHKVLGWLMADSNYYCSGLEQCLRDLEDDASRREPAVALFWIVYMADEEPLRLKEDQVHRIETLLRLGPGRGGEAERRRHALVRLHLVGTLTTSLIRPGVQLSETPRAVAALEAVSTIEPQEGIDVVFDNQWARKALERDVFTLSTVLVLSIVAIELALWRTYEERYDEALSLMSDAINVLEVTMFQSLESAPPPGTFHRIDPRSNPMPRSFSYLPHSWDDFDAQDAVRIFDKLSSHPDKVKDWDVVWKACRTIGSSDLMLEFDHVTNGEGEVYPPQVYWEKATTFAEYRLSPDQLRRALEDADKESAERRLQRDFFDDVWRHMPSEAWEHLVEAENHWWAKRKTEYGDMIDDYRECLETLLAYLFPFLAKRARKSMPPLRPGDKPPSLRISRMNERLERDTEVRESIRGLLSQEDSQFVLERLPGCLASVAFSRNYFAHPESYPRTSARDAEEAARKVRRELLGIQCEQSVIRRLIEIKRAMGPKATP